MKAVIFDLDGTLWDTSDTVVDIWNSVLSVKCPTHKMNKQVMASLMGKNQAGFVNDFFAGVEKDRANEIIKEIFKAEQKHLRQFGAKLYEGVQATLNKLKDDYAIMIVSNCQSGYLDAFLDYYELRGVLTDYECAGSSGLSKGENIKLVLKRNNIEKAIYVGDTKSDEVAAKEAGVAFVYASYGFADVESYDYKIDEFCDIEQAAYELLVE